jgi:DNA polymerase II small subunit
MKEKIKLLMDKGYLLDPDIVGSLDSSSFDLIVEHVDPKSGGSLTKDVLENLKEKYVIKVPVEGENEEFDGSSIKFLKDYPKITKKVEVFDFIEHYKIRYNYIRKILQSRLELTDTISINRVFGKMEREKVSLIGLVSSKTITKNNNILMDLEDPTGSIKLLVNFNKNELFEKASDVVLDEVIGISGNLGNGIVFVNELFFPDVPLEGNELKKSPVNECMAFISDLHLGSENFLELEFIKFIKWLNGETGTSEQKKVAKSIKYLFVAGDIVAGIGVYPGQEADLVISELGAQYDRCAELFGMVREDVEIIISPGNHDAIRLAEPQPLFDEKYAKGLYALKNVKLTGNPSLVNFGSSKGFSGFDVLMYHGFSFSYYIDNIDRLRLAGGFDNAGEIMKFLLQKRHLAPSHTSTLFIVDPKRDDLIIDCIPDFFVCGHAHKFTLGQYGKTTLMAGSCWETKSKYQIKGGHNPEPGRVPVINLKTREVKLMKFYDENV